jgi:hypothetical protein
MWYFVHTKSGTEWRGELALYWELEGSAVSDDYSPEDTDAYELWQIWRRHYPNDYEHTKLGKGWIPIYWAVTGVGDLKTFERAPFANEFLTDALGKESENFLTHFTWPEQEETRELLRWTTVPVVDKHWRRGQADKGGFVQEATGWKPGPLQPVIYLPNLAKAARLAPN